MREEIIEGKVKFTRYGNSHNFRDYDNWELDVNRGWREATLLARSSYSFLFMYEISFKQYLAEVSVGLSGRFDPHSYKSVNREKLPRKWDLAEWFVNRADYKV